MKKSNNFRFKQFEVIQQKSAMKVGTDGVLLGAWVDIDDSVDSILDIGTGTGLIALMLAQRSNSIKIHAVELDKGACSEANDNFHNSPWYDRLTVSEGSIIDYANICDRKYDLIVCNPPFFTNGVRASIAERSQARHTDSLSFSDLTKATKCLLSSSGKFSVVIPTDQKEVFEEEANKAGLYLSKQLTILPNNTKPSKRILLSFTSKLSSDISEEVLQIETDERHRYTSGYKELTKEFYLNF